MERKSKRISVNPAFRVALLSSCIFVGVGGPAWGNPQASGKTSTLDMVPSELKDRQIDQVALHAKEQAVEKLKKLVKKYGGTSQESRLLMNLAESYQGCADLEFRIAYAQAHQRKVEPKLSKYNSILISEIETVNKIIEKFPSYIQVDQALLMRAKAYEELKQKDSAKSDYLRLVKNYPESNFAISAYMALSEIAIERNSYLEAVGYLKEVEKETENHFYPFALYKLSWAYFNLRDIHNAIVYIKKHIQFYDKLKASQETFLPADSAIRENSLMDFVAFYIEGNEKTPSLYPMSSAFGEMKNLEKGSFFGKMLVRMSKILRSHRRDEDLIQWKSKIIELESQTPETIEVVTLVFEHQMNQEQFEKMNQTASDFLVLYNGAKDEVRQSEEYKAAKVFLAATAGSLQNRYQKAKGTKTARRFVDALVSVYQTLIQVLPENDPRLAQSHFNLAEILFGAGDFEKATQSYRWIVSKGTGTSGLDLATVELKSIASRYESLRQGQKIPEKLEALPLDSSKSDDLRGRLDPPVFEWIEWIDDWATRFEKNKGHHDDFDSFEFEASRTIYAHNSVKAATDRLIRFAEKKPNSKFAIPAATLVLDSYVKSNNWTECSDLALRFLEVPWKDLKFKERVQGIAADAMFKVAEKLFDNQNFSEFLNQAKRLQQKFPKNPRAAETLLLTAKGHLGTQKKELAQADLSLLIKTYPESKGAKAALIMRAKLSEEDYDFEQAASDYGSYLNADPSNGQVENLNEVYQHLFFLQWIKGSGSYDCTRFEKLKDATENQVQCQRFEALSYLREGASSGAITPEFLERAFDLAKEGPKDNRPLWAMVSLKNDPGLKIRDQINFLRLFSKNWDKLNSLEQLGLVAVVNSVLPEALRKTRANLRHEVPMKKASAIAISRRIEWMKEYEGAVMQVLSLPWNRVKAAALFELSGIYRDFNSTLSELSKPKDLSEQDLKEYEQGVAKILDPFRVRVEELANQAYQLASSSSVEDDVLEEIKKQFPKLSEKSQAELQKSIDVKKYSVVVKFNLEFENQLGLERQKNDTAAHGDFQRYLRLKKSWKEAFFHQHWAKCAYILQDFKKLDVISQEELKLLQALTLIASGAQSEGLGLLQSLQEKLNPEAKFSVGQALLSHFIHSGSVENSIRMSKEVAKLEAILEEKKRGASGHVSSGR